MAARPDAGARAAPARGRPIRDSRVTDALQDRYRAWRESRLGAITERVELAALLELAQPGPGERVLDAGCGDGAYSIACAERGARVIGIDLSAQMLVGARERSAARGLAPAWCRADVTALPFPDASFDLALAVTLLCLVPDARRAVRELARVLVPGGRLVVGELHRWSSWAVRRRLRGWSGDTLWRDAHFWSRGEIEGLLREAGLATGRVRGAIYYPPYGSAARLLADLDPRLARISAFGAAFLVVEGVKPGPAAPGDPASAPAPGRSR
jgi:SAM-dependent methyltransferase